MRARAGKGLAVLMLVGAVAACSYQIDQIRIHVDSERHGSFVLRSSAPLDIPRDDAMDAEALANSSSYQTAQKFEQRLRSCGLGTTLYTKPDGKLYLNARMVFEYADDAATALACAPTSWSDVDFDVTKKEGLIWNTYTTRLVLGQSTLYLETSSPEDSANSESSSTPDINLNDLRNFPLMLRLAVPGKIESISNDSAVLGGHVKVERVGSSAVKLSFTTDYDEASADSKIRQRYLESQSRAFAEGRFKAAQIGERGEDRLAIAIVSHERNFRLQDILSILGVLFGSGLMFQFGKRWLGRRSARRQVSARPPEA